MNVKQGFPYRIIPHRVKQYADHYNILPEKCLIVPVKIFGNEASCDIRWEDDNGTARLLGNKFFSCENLVPLNALHEFELHGIWKQFYHREPAVALMGEIKSI